MERMEIGDVVTFTCTCEPLMTVTGVYDTEDGRMVRVVWVDSKGRSTGEMHPQAVFVLILKRSKATGIIRDEFRKAMGEGE